VDTTTLHGEEQISDSTVAAKTGKSWKEWFATLDDAGANTLSHQAIVAILGQRHGLTPWWRQMVTVEYERARGMRAKHDRPNGFEIGVSRTIDAPVALVYRVLSDSTIRSSWLGDHPIGPRRSIPERSFRAAWLADSTLVDFNLAPKGESRCQVTVQHSKLPNADRAAEMKQFWKSMLERLEAELVSRR
jgi:uncharacterized protein YndB with AHSA1/START domain